VPAPSGPAKCNSPPSTGVSKCQRIASPASRSVMAAWYGAPMPNPPRSNRSYPLPPVARSPSWSVIVSAPSPPFRLFPPPRPSVDQVAAGAAGDDVGECVTDCREASVADEREILDVVGKRVGHRGDDGVVPFTGVLDDLVAGQEFVAHEPTVEGELAMWAGFDHVGVVASAADHDVIPALAVDVVVAGKAVELVGRVVAGDGIVERVAPAVDRGVCQARLTEDQILDVVRQAVTHIGDDLVVALAGILDHLIARAGAPESADRHEDGCR